MHFNVVVAPKPVGGIDLVPLLVHRLPGVDVDPLMQHEDNDLAVRPRMTLLDLPLGALRYRGRVGNRSADGCHVMLWRPWTPGACTRTHPFPLYRLGTSGVAGVTLERLHGRFTPFRSSQGFPAENRQSVLWRGGGVGGVQTLP